MNYVFLFFDQLRSESLSCYGHPLVKTPNFDRLANEGVRFDQNYTQCVLCSPSRCSLVTGWYPHVNGHRTLWHLLRPHEPSMFRYLRDNGYHVEMYGKNDIFSEEYIPLALDHYEVVRGGRFGANPYDKEDPRYYSFKYEAFLGELHETKDMKCVQKGIDFMNSRKKGDKPFFLYLPIEYPHPPYSAPEPFHSMYKPEDIPPLRPVDSEQKLPSFHKLMRKYRKLDQNPDEFMKEIHATYLGMVSYSDWILGQLLDALDKMDLKDETTVIVSSDHGDFAGDYGLVEKIHNAFYDVTTRVPLLIRTPGCSAGHVVREQTELFDIMATVLDISGIEATHTHFARSLVPQLQGASGDRSRAVFAEAGFNSSEKHCFEGHDPSHPTRVEGHIYWPQTMQQQQVPKSISRTTMIRTLEAKLIRRPDDVHELYDLVNDPLETRNVYDDPAYKKLQDELNLSLLDWYIRTSDVVPHNDDNRSFPKE